jgi:hypothetical protein
MILVPLLWLVTLDLPEKIYTEMTVKQRGKWGLCPRCKIRAGKMSHPCPLYEGKMCRCCRFCERDCRLDSKQPDVTIAEPEWLEGTKIRKKRIRRMARRKI